MRTFDSLPFRRLTLLAGALSLLLAACGNRAGSGPSDGDSGNPGGDAGATTDSGTVLDDAGTTDGGNPLAVPLIGEALGCGRVGIAGGLGAGTELQQLEIDTSVFPDALCNDGTPAVIYYRPYAGDVNRNRWVVQLQGGGSCASGEECAKRWCMVDTNFSMHGMTSSIAPDGGIAGNGILARRADNPAGNWNQVFVKYCSSDEWYGTRRDVVVHVDDPRADGPTDYRIHFLGARILDAVIATLRGEGVAPIDFTLGGANETMPDLDDATMVVLAGGSAGGRGAIGALDHVNQTLGGNRVRGLFDSAVPLPGWELDWSTSEPCSKGICSWETSLDFARTMGSDALWGSRYDESCVSWHAANAPADARRCSDPDYVLLNHVTAPFFVRMGQTDSNVSSRAIAQGYTVPGQGQLTLDLFASGVRDTMAAIANIQSTANERDAITVAPGVFSPVCSDHETLSDNPAVFTTSIQQGGTDYLLMQVMANWALGGSPTVVIQPEGGAGSCPPG